jgi:kynurenine formamidase
MVQRIEPDLNQTGVTMTESYEFSDSAYEALVERWSTRGKWGEGDQLGTLNRLGPRTALAALALVRTGEVVPLGGRSRLGDQAKVVDGAPSPATLRQWYECGQDWASTNDRFSTDIHGALSQTHMDFLHHFFRDELNYLGWSRARTQAEFGVDPATEGVVARGVLVDIAGFNGGPLPVRAVRRDELRAVLDAQGTELREDDAVFFRFGVEFDKSDRQEMGPAPGLHIDCADIVLEGSPALIGSDYGTDVNPSPVPGCAVPWHLLLLVYAGIRMIDGANLGRLAQICAERSRYEFALVAAPLMLPGASGSPLNPLAIL